MNSFDSQTRADGFLDECMSHMDALYGVACRLTRNPTEAEDLVQDALVKAMRARDQFQAGTNLKAWLFRILTNTFINKYRRGGLERSVLEGPDADPLADGWVSASTMRQLRDPEQIALLPIVEGEVRKALDLRSVSTRSAISRRAEWRRDWRRLALLRTAMFKTAPRRSQLCKSA